jgi:hypothetical protein
MSDDSHLPPGLAKFGRHLEDVGRHDREEELREARRGKRHRFRALPTTVAVAVLAGGVAAGATALLDDNGPPINREPDGGDSVAPVDASVVAATRTADPGGGLPWILRVFTNARGDECVVLGRLKRGRFGQVQQGRFRALPASTPGLCDNAERSGLLTFLDRRAAPPRTAVYGITKGTGLVTVRLGDTERRVAPVALGAYLVVVALEKGSATVTTELAGQTVVRRVG